MGKMDVARASDVTMRFTILQSRMEVTMVMIPKAGKDHTTIKGWRPIVFANTIGKLCRG